MNTTNYRYLILSKKKPAAHLQIVHGTQFRKHWSTPGVGNCFGLRAASRSRKLAEGRTV